MVSGSRQLLLLLRLSARGLIFYPEDLGVVEAGKGELLLERQIDQAKRGL